MRQGPIYVVSITGNLTRHYSWHEPFLAPAFGPGRTWIMEQFQRTREILERARHDGFPVTFQHF